MMNLNKALTTLSWNVLSTPSRKSMIRSDIYDYKEAMLTKCSLVDKTKEVAKFLKFKSQCFIVRPRKSGKTLAMTTAVSILNGEEHLFIGTKLGAALESGDPSVAHIRELFNSNRKYKELENMQKTLWYKFKSLVGLATQEIDITPSGHSTSGFTGRVTPLLLDFSEVNDKPEYFEKSLADEIRVRANLIGLELKLSDPSPVSAIKELYRTANERNMRIAMLIDEYDVPIVRLLEENDKKMDENIRKNIAVLKSVFASLKVNHGRHGYCLMVTGVSKFSFISLFSGANTLKDVSFDHDFNKAFHFTWNDIETTFGLQLAKLLKVREEKSLEELKQTITDMYGGYRFDSDFQKYSERLYNPFDICSLMEDIEAGKSIPSCGDLPGYWVNRGKSAFLNKIFTDTYLTDGLWTIPQQFDNLASTLENINPHNIDESCTPLLLQTGYLTIDKQETKDDHSLLLVKPANMHTNAFLRKQMVTSKCERLGLPSYQYLMKQDITGFLREISRYTEKSVSYAQTITSETAMQNKITTLLYLFKESYTDLSKLIIDRESSNAAGRLDFLVYFNHSGDSCAKAVIIEFKMLKRNKSSKEIVASAIDGAFKQINNKKYDSLVNCEANIVEHCAVVWNSNGTIAGMETRCVIASDNYTRSYEK